MLANNTLSTFAGTGSCGMSGDGAAATLSTINPAWGLAVADPLGPGGGLVFADTGNNVVRRVLPSGVIVRVAGTGVAGYSGDGGAATSAALNYCLGVTPDGLGNLYITDFSNHCIRVVSAVGVIKTAVGTCGASGFLGDGMPGTSSAALLNKPTSVAFDGSGGLFISEQGNQIVRYVSSAGILSTVAGTAGVSGTSGDGGTATAALFNNPSVTGDGAGGYLVADTWNNVVRRLTLQTPSPSRTATLAAGASASPSALPLRPFVITKVAGTALSAGFSGDGGPATSAKLNGVCLPCGDGAGNYLLPDQTNHAIRFVAATGTITTIAGVAASAGYSGEGLAATSSRLSSPVSIAPYGGGYVIINRGSCRLTMLWANLTMSTFAGTGTCGLTGDSGPATSANVNPGWGLGIADSGPVGGFVWAENSNSVVRRVLPSGVVVRVAGTGTAGYGGDFGPATAALLNACISVAPDGLGGLFIADITNHCVRFVSAAGFIRSVAGTCGASGFLGDGQPATAPSALLNKPTSVALDGSGGLFITEQGNQVVRFVSAAGILSTVAGTAGTSGTAGDGGVATSAFLNNPSIGPDGTGMWIIADTWSSIVRRMTLQTATQTPSATRTASPSASVGARPWNVFRAAGTGTSGNTGENGPATAAQIGGPGFACKDGAGFGGFYFSDQTSSTVKRVFGNGTLMTVATVTSNPPAVGLFAGGPVNGGGLLINCRSRVLMLWANGTLSTVAGTGVGGLSGDGGLATLGQISGGWGAVVADPAGPGGGWVLADQGNHVVRRVTAAGIIVRVAGTGAASYSGDNGAATSATLSGPCGVSPDGLGNLFIADTYNSAIRRVTFAGVITTVAGTPTLSGFTGDGGPATLARLNAPLGVAYESPLGGLFLSNQWDNRVRYVSPLGIISTVMGTGVASLTGDGGRATLATLNNPSIGTDDGVGGWLISDANNNVIRRLTLATGSQTATMSATASQTPSQSPTVTFTAARQWMIRLYAGTYTGGYSGDGGAATSAQLSAPGMGCPDGAGGFVFTEQNTHVVRQVLASGIIQTIAGTAASSGYAGEGVPWLSTKFSFPAAVTPFQGGYLVQSRGTCRVTMLWPNGTSTTAAGTGTCGLSGTGGLATMAAINPGWASLSADPFYEGTWLLAEQSTSVVRRILANGLIVAYAGTGSAGTTGNGGPASSAQLNGAFNVAPDGMGGAFIADYSNHAIRYVDPSGIISVVAGALGTAGFGGDGQPATSPTARLASPMGLIYQSGGGLVWSEQGNILIRYCSAGGILSTIANVQRVAGATGDGGFALLARLWNPTCGSDGLGNIIVSDSNNNVLRRLFLQTPTQTATLTQTPSQTRTQSSTATNTGTPSVTQTLTASSTQSPTATPTPSSSPTPSVTQTVSITQTASSSGTSTLTPSATGTPTSTATPSTTQSPSYTGSASQTLSPSLSPTPSATVTASQTSSASLTQSPSGAATPSTTSTPTTTVTSSSTQSGSLTATSTQSPSQAATPSSSQLGTLSQSGSATLTQTQSPSATASTTPSQGPTPTQSTSFVLTSTPSPTGTASQTASQAASPSQSLTQSPTSSLSGTPTQTASSAATPSSSQVPTPSGTATATSTRSQTASQSSSGFPLSVVFDNTAGLLDPIAAAARPVSGATLRAVAVYWPEDNPACGPGLYQLAQLRLPLSAASLAVVTFGLQLFTVSNASAPPLRPQTLLASGTAVATVTTVASYVLLSIPSHFFADTLVSRFHVLVWNASAPVSWLDATDAAGDVPTRGTGVPAGALVSTDAGSSWSADASYAGVQLSARKRLCSPTPTRTPTSSQTQTQSPSVSGSSTPSQGPTPTQSTSFVLTATRTPSETPSQSGSQACTPSQSQTASVTASQTSSPTLTPSPSPSASQTQTSTQAATRSQSASQAATPSSTTSATATPSPSSSATASQWATASQTPSFGSSLSQTRSVSQATTPSGTASPSQAPSGTQSGSGTGSASGARTPSQSGSSSQSPSSTRSPTQSRSAAPTPSATASQAGSGSATCTTSVSLAATRSATQAASASPSSAAVAPASSSSRSPSGSAAATASSSTSISSSPAPPIALSASASPSPACVVWNVPLSLTLSGGVTPAAVLAPSVGLLARLSFACYLGVPLTDLLITSVANSTVLVPVAPGAAVNAEDGPCSLLSPSGGASTGSSRVLEEGWREPLLLPALLLGSLESELTSRQQQQREQSLLLGGSGSSGSQRRRVRGLGDSSSSGSSLVVVSLVASVVSCSALSSTGTPAVPAQLNALLLGLANATASGNTTAPAQGGASQQQPQLGVFLTAAAREAGVPPAGVTSSASAGTPALASPPQSSGGGSGGGGSSAAFPVVAVVAAIGGALLLALAVIVVVLCVRRRKQECRGEGPQGAAATGGTIAGTNPMRGPRGLVAFNAAASSGGPPTSQRRSDAGGAAAAAFSAKQPRRRGSVRSTGNAPRVSPGSSAAMGGGEGGSGMQENPLRGGRAVSSGPPPGSKPGAAGRLYPRTGAAGVDAAQAQQQQALQLGEFSMTSNPMNGGSVRGGQGVPVGADATAASPAAAVVGAGPPASSSDEAASSGSGLGGGGRSSSPHTGTSIAAASSMDFYAATRGGAGASAAGRRPTAAAAPVAGRP